MFAADGIIAKGHEAGGCIGEETTFVLLQRFLTELRLPVWAQGGIGLHSAAACVAAGAAGVILDCQLALLRESPLAGAVRARIASMDGSETICLGQAIGAACRFYDGKPAGRAVAALRQLESRLVADQRSPAAVRAEWRQAIAERVGWESADENLLCLGQDAAFARDMAQRFNSVSGVVRAVRDAVGAHCAAARRLQPLAAAAPLARSHGTRYPILQGPMTRVSDVAPFAADVAAGGALPFLALALMRGPEVEALLAETQRRLGAQPWGVGILGFVPPELRLEQIAVVERFRPPFALIAGGRPDQARALEQHGIATYLHVPSPGLLQMFLRQGARRFVFEGRECGGHVGPRTSFVLWDQSIDLLLDALSNDPRPQDFHIVFAGGIHDARSAAMVAAMAAPLAERGACVGVLLGTAYLFTHEAVAGGAILDGFQQQALECARTVLLESGPGHATRCVDTPFAAAFRQEKRRLIEAGRSAEDIRLALEELNLGRLRIAAKGIVRQAPPGDGAPGAKFASLNAAAQVEQGMYMIGQVATMRSRICSIAELHRDVADGSSQRLAALPDRIGLRASAAPPERAADVAIVGMACLLPKAGDLRRYWDNILDKVDAITEIPQERWDYKRYFDPDPQARDKIYSKWGGFLDDIAFDPMQWGMPPASLRSIEPAQLLTLEVVRAALQDAGYATREFPRERTAVILGAGGGAADLGLGYGGRAFVPNLERLAEFSGRSPELLERLGSALPEWTEDSFAGILTNVAAGRVANRFDLGGTNYTVDAACASSLAAIALAVRELEDHTSDMVIVGGVDTMQNPFTYLCFSKTRALSPRGRCRTFDESADGIVLSEGLAMLVLKRLADAERDGDRIYAVIKGVGSSSDGKDKGLTAPRPEGQARALRRAYAKADFSPATVGLIEAHGTGTVAGDRAEIRALTDVFSQAAAAPQQCAIGSVKSMIGHTKCTAGAAGLIKAALALHHKVLPPTLGVETPNSSVDFSSTPFFVNADVRPWLDGVDGQPRRAGVSAFGFGGTNFHVALEEYSGDSAPGEAAAQPVWPGELFIWQGASRQAVLQAVEPCRTALDAPAPPALRDLAHAVCTSGAGLARAAGGGMLRLAVIAGSIDDLRQKLASARQALADPQTVRISDPRGIYFNAQPLVRAADDGAKLAMLFPGQGSQYPNMLRDLAVHFPEVRSLFALGDRVLAGRLDKRLSAYVFPPSSFTPDESRAQQAALTATNVAQPAIGVAGLAMFRVLQALGLQADFVAGHSYGEYVALAAAGVMSDAALISLSEARGRFIVEAATDEAGQMAAVEASTDVVAAGLRGIDGVVIANANAPKQTVISGTREAIERAVRVFSAQGLAVRVLPVACAFHSPIVAPAQQKLAEFLAEFELAEPGLAVYSNTTAAPYPQAPAAIVSQLVDHLVRPVEFVQEIEAMYAAGARIFIEAGPRGVLTSLVDQILGDRPKLALASNQSGRSGVVQLLHLLGQLAVEGIGVKLDRLFAGRVAGGLDLGAAPAAPQPHAPTVWLVNGGRARPAQEPKMPPPVAAEPAVSGMLQRRPATSGIRMSPHQAAATSRTLGGAPDPATNGTSQPSAPLTDAQLSPLAAAIPSALHAHGTGDGVAAAMTQFQQLMARFLDTQKSVMLSFLANAAGSVTPDPLPNIAPWDLQPAVEDSTQRTVGIQAQPAADGAADADAAHGHAIASGMDAATDAAAPTPARPDAKQLTVALLAVVSERTGYPPEMLDLDLDLEADLGIDSIKRVEILGNFQQSVADAGFGRSDGVMEKLAGVRTLRGIIDGIATELNAPVVSDAAAGAAAAGRAGAHMVPPAAAPPAVALAEAARPAARVERFTLTAVDRPLRRAGRPLSPGGVLLLTDDELGCAEAMAARLRDAGHAVALVRQRLGTQALGGGVYEADLRLPQAAAQLVEMIGEAQGSLSAVIHLLPLKGIEIAAMEFDGWRERLRTDVKSLFYLAKAASGALRLAAATGGASLIAATAMGGGFLSAASSNIAACFAGQGGVAGLIKSLAQEWPGVRLKAVDLNPAEPAQVLADHLLDELLHGDDEVEVGYDGRRRMALEPRRSPVSPRAQATLALDASSVLLITGGARGISAQVALRLAEEYRPTLLVVGRSPLPAAEEGSETAGLTGAKDLKAALMEQLRRQGQPVTPAVVEDAYERLLVQRDVRRNLAALQQLGAKTHYLQADVRDAAAFGELIEQIYRSYGRLDGVIHGAGVIEDRLVEDKTPESFDRVFDTKADSAFVLGRKLRPQTLQFLVFFASVAGRFGNRGQGDYAAANEVLNKLAVQLDCTWPGRVVAINWGPWDADGMVSADIRKHFAARGVEMIPPAEGLRCLQDELLHGRKGEAEVIIGGAGWQPQVDQSDVASPATPCLPLIKRTRVLRTNGSVQLELELRPGHDLYLQDHRLDGRPVFPLAMATELMAEVAAQGWPDLQVASVRDLFVLQGIVLHEETKTVRVRGTSQPTSTQGPLSLAFEIVGTEPQPRIHYRAVVDMVPALPDPPPFEARLLTRGSRLSLALPEAYRRWLFHGPLFHGIQQVNHIGADGVAAMLCASSPVGWISGAANEPWLIDPLMLDSALQLLILWSREHWDMTTLPARYRSYRRFAHQPSQEIRCEMRIRPETGGQSIHADIIFVNVDGCIVGIMEDAEGTCARSLNRLAGTDAAAILNDSCIAK